jgi:hypothetical protein
MNVDWHDECLSAMGAKRTFECGSSRLIEARERIQAASIFALDPFSSFLLEYSESQRRVVFRDAKLPDNRSGLRWWRPAWTTCFDEGGAFNRIIEGIKR